MTFKTYEYNAHPTVCFPRHRDLRGLWKRLSFRYRQMLQRIN